MTDQLFDMEEDHLRVKEITHLTLERCWRNILQDIQSEIKVKINYKRIMNKYKVAQMVTITAPPYSASESTTSLRVVLMSLLLSHNINLNLATWNGGSSPAQIHTLVLPEWSSPARSIIITDTQLTNSFFPLTMLGQVSSPCHHMLCNTNIDSKPVIFNHNHSFNENSCLYC